MDAQHGSDDRCQQHLQRDGNPADKQSHGNTTSDRSPVEMPYHRLGKGVAGPGTKGAGVGLGTTQLQVQLAAQGVRIRQLVLEPVTRHGLRSELAGAASVLPGTQGRLTRLSGGTQQAMSVDS